MGQADRLSLFVNITTAETVTVYSGACMLERVTVNAGAGPITIYNNSAASGSRVATIGSTPKRGTYGYDCLCGSGVTIVNGAASDITVAINPLSSGELGTPAIPPPVIDEFQLLLESGDVLLLESGDDFLLE